MVTTKAHLKLYLADDRPRLAPHGSSSGNAHNAPWRLQPLAPRRQRPRDPILFFSSSRLLPTHPANPSETPQQPHGDISVPAF